MMIYDNLRKKNTTLKNMHQVALSEIKCQSETNMQLNQVCINQN